MNPANTQMGPGDLMLAMRSLPPRERMTVVAAVLYLDMMETGSDAHHFFVDLSHFFREQEDTDTVAVFTSRDPDATALLKAAYGVYATKAGGDRTMADGDDVDAAYQHAAETHGCQCARCVERRRKGAQQG